MRGNHSSGGTSACGNRSIPAYAGEPSINDLQCLLTMVYPRVCGGTQAEVVVTAGDVGLSPRMRGNPAAAAVIVIVIVRSIPAYAGEPRCRPSRWRSRWVYPRVCGGTRGRNRCRRDEEGLSPRMRGNLEIRGFERGVERSIPAYAGEPDTWKAQSPGCWVYPRVCGGTDSG